MSQKYYTYKQASERLGISYRLVQKYVYEGRLGKHLPTGYIITEDDLTEFEKINRSPGRPPKDKSS